MGEEFDDPPPASVSLVLGGEARRRGEDSSIMVASVPIYQNMTFNKQQLEILDYFLPLGASASSLPGPLGLRSTFALSPLCRAVAKNIGGKTQYVIV